MAVEEWKYGMPPKCEGMEQIQDGVERMQRQVGEKVCLCLPVKKIGREV